MSAAMAPALGSKWEDVSRTGHGHTEPVKLDLTSARQHFGAASDEQRGSSHLSQRAVERYLRHTMSYTCVYGTRCPYKCVYGTRCPYTRLFKAHGAHTRVFTVHGAYTRVFEAHGAHTFVCLRHTVPIHVCLRHAVSIHACLKINKKRHFISPTREYRQGHELQKHK